MPITYDNGDYPAALERARAHRRGLAGTARRRPSPRGRLRQLRPDGRRSARARATRTSASTWARGSRRSPAWSPTAPCGCSSAPAPRARATPRRSCSWPPTDSASPPDDIELVHSDTDRSPYSAYGTAASRCDRRRGRGRGRGHRRPWPTGSAQIAAELLEAAPADIVLGDRRATVAGTNVVGLASPRSPERAWQGWALPEGDAMPGLEAPLRLRPEAVHVLLRHPRLSGRRRPRHRHRRDRALRRGARLRHGRQPDHRRGPGPRRRRPGPRRRPARGRSCVDDDAQPRTTTLLDYLLPVSASRCPTSRSSSPRRRRRSRRAG